MKSTAYCVNSNCHKNNLCNRYKTKIDYYGFSANFHEVCDGHNDYKYFIEKRND